MSPQTHAKAMVDAMGLTKALKVATSCLKSSDPSEWSSLPISSVFCKMNRYGKYTSLYEKPLINTHRFWSNVVGLLKNSR